MYRILLLLGLLLPCGEASALRFTTLGDAEGRPILLVYDCEMSPLKEAAKCEEFENGFQGPEGRYPGDAAVLEAKLRERDHFQVWLHSGGGNLDEGVKVGEVLRRHRQYVVVPDGLICVSACTVAFLGGVLRDVSQTGGYKVHAYSGVLSAKKQDLQHLLGTEGEFGLARFAKSRSENGAVWAARLFLYAQKMINGQPDEMATHRVLAGAPDFAKAYIGGVQFRADLARMRAEGAGAAQDVLMRIERESFETRLAHLKAHADELGARSRPAIRMLEIMFSSRIAGTAQLDQVTLRENGYINVRR